MANEEEMIVKELILQSPQFAKYYGEIRPKLAGPVTWLRTSEGNSIDASVDLDNRRIWIPRIPPLISDALIVAHELQHLFDYDVYKTPVTRPFSKYASTPIATLSGAINSSVLDLRINRELLKFDFDLQSDTRKQITDSMASLPAIEQGPRPGTERFFHFALNYAAKKIELKLILGDTFGVDDEKIFAVFDERFPTIAEESKKIQDALLSVDLNSNSSILKYFSWTLSKYNLREYIKI